MATTDSFNVLEGGGSSENNRVSESLVSSDSENEFDVGGVPHAPQHDDDDDEDEVGSTLRRTLARFPFALLPKLLTFSASCTVVVPREAHPAEP